MNESKPQRRQSCAQCLRPTSNCLCPLIQKVDNRVELIILQHPLEVHQAKNTARLLHLCLNKSQLHIGEKFGESFFVEIDEAAEKDSIFNILLYPETAEEKSLGIASPPRLDLATFESGENIGNINTLRLWVLDATWRKSRKMLYLNPPLQHMPRLNLCNPPESLYSIRKAHSKNQLSTLEASCYALQQLEDKRVDYQPLLSAFAAFIRQQTFFIPSP